MVHDITLDMVIVYLYLDYLHYFITINFHKLLIMNFGTMEILTYE